MVIIGFRNTGVAQYRGEQLPGTGEIRGECVHSVDLRSHDRDDFGTGFESWPRIAGARQNAADHLGGQPGGQQGPDPEHGADGGVVEAAVAVTFPRCRQQPLALVVPQRAGAAAGAFRQFADLHFAHLGLDLDADVNVYRIRMQIGIFTGVTDESIGPADLARAVEERGFESLFVAEHTHIPVTVATPYTGGDEIPRDYYRNFDPFITLAVAAAVTRRLRIGTAVTLVVQRDPIVLAKEVASLDMASGGRLELGVGVGWLREEMRNHGTDPRTRVALQRERLLAMTAIWTREQAEFHGEFVDFDPLYSWPKPVQRPRPPIWLGGWGPSTHERILDHADGWLAPVGLPLDDLEKGVRDLWALAEHQGRPPVPVTATLFDPQPGDLERLAELGVHRTLLGIVPVLPGAEALRALDRFAELS